MYEASTLLTRSSRVRASKITASVVDRQPIAFNVTVFYFQGAQPIAAARYEKKFQMFKVRFLASNFFCMRKFEYPFFEWNVFQISRFFIL